MQDIFSTGSRIRQQRISKGVAQVDLAATVGISASYLNLIEHNRRRIAGKLLIDIARALDCDPAQLAAGAEPGRLAALRDAGLRAGLSARQIALSTDLAAQYPDWAGLIAAQAGQIARLEMRVIDLADRLRNDPDLAHALHDVLTSVTAIHSSAAILVEDKELDRDWQQRFSRNIHAESGKLSEASRALVGYLDRPDAASGAAADPVDEAQTWLVGGGLQESEALISAGASAEEAAHRAPVSKGAAFALRRWLETLAGDMAALPLTEFSRSARSVAHDPERIAALTGASPARVLRRLASLPADLTVPMMTVIQVDAGGGIVALRNDLDLPFPSGSVTCPLWPVYSSLSRPGQVLRRRIALPGDAAPHLVAYAVAEAEPGTEWADSVRYRGVMLVTSAPPSGALPALKGDSDGLRAAPKGGLADAEIAVGRGCRICSRPDCAARRELSILAPL